MEAAGDKSGRMSDMEMAISVKQGNFQNKTHSADSLLHFPVSLC